MTDKMVQNYLRALLYLLEHDRVEDVKECLRMSIVEDYSDWAEKAEAHQHSKFLCG